MSDVDTGTGDFPTAAQLGAGIIARKSATADATARAWKVVADGRTVYVFIVTGDYGSAYYAFAFGDIFSYVPGDQYGVCIIGRDAENSGHVQYERIAETTTITGNDNGHFIARPYTGAGTSLQFGKHHDRMKGSDYIGRGALAYTNPSDGKLWLSPLWVHEPAQPTVRGYLRGFYAPMHSYAYFTDQDTFSGTGPLAGKTFTIFRDLMITYNGWQVAVAMETSDTWDSD